MSANHGYSCVSASHFIKAKVECGTYRGYKEWFLANYEKYHPGKTYKYGYSCIPIASNVHLHYDVEYDVMEIRLYSTLILRFFRDGRFSASAGYHPTMTTVTRMNQFGPAHVRFWRHNYAVHCSYGPCEFSSIYFNPAETKIPTLKAGRRIEPPKRRPKPPPRAPVPCNPLIRRKRTLRSVECL